MIKTILFPITDGNIPLAALDATCELARRHKACITAAVCVNAVSPFADSANYYPVEIYEAFGTAARALELKLKAELEARLRAAEVQYAIQTASSFLMSPAELASVHARYYDLVVFGRAPDANARAERNTFATLLFHSGRPVLVMPAHIPAESLDAVAVVAWKPTREASRAVHDALPLLARSRSVRVLSVQPATGDFGHGELVGADIGAELARHGLRVESVQRTEDPGGTAATLLNDAREQGAGLLVAGGYGHRRLREFLFGGVTFELFDGATLPVLYSH